MLSWEDACYTFCILWGLTMLNRLSSLSALSTLVMAVGSLPVLAQSLSQQSAPLLAQAETGTLEFRASGEDRAVDGFTSKDGWELSFDHIYVTLADLTAYQTDPPFDAFSEEELAAAVEVSLGDPITVDLTADADDEDSVLVGSVTAPAGRYNALSWRVVPAPDGPAEGYSMVFAGSATRDGETVNFVLKLSSEVTYSCGDFVGDVRKGILAANDTSDVQATFHLDHLFGEEGKEESFNQIALGFDPLAELATDGRVDVSTEELAELLSAEDYALLTETVFPELGHAGEGHCRVSDLTV